MSSHRSVALAVLGVLLAPPARAQTAPASPRVERTVTPGAAGPNRLAIDSTFLVSASPLVLEGRGANGSWTGLGDLRLFDAAQGRELPYLLVWPSPIQERFITARPVPVTPRKDTSGFELDLAGPRTIDRFSVPGLEERQLKRVRLEGSGDRATWIVLVEDGTLFNLPPETSGSAPIRQTDLAFAPVTVRYLRLTADDHAGAPLAVPAYAYARLATGERAGADTLRSVLSFERRPSARRTSRYHVTLPATQLPIVALELDVGGDQVLRTARVTEPRMGSGRVAPVELGASTLRRRTVGGVTASDLRIRMHTPVSAELDLVIDDGDNPPLDLRSVRAVYATMPYIFFESPDGAALRAAYGTDRRDAVGAPRYDLEALRDTVSRIAAAAAAWGPVRAGAFAVAADAPAALRWAPGAPLDVKRFREARRLPEGTGLTAVRLDAAVLAHSRIEDVRILDAQGRQVPYLLETLDEPTELTLAALEPVVARTDVDGRTLAGAARWTWYRVRLPYHGLPGATLRLETSARVFARDIAIVTRELPRDAQPQYTADAVVNAAWVHDDPETATPPLEVALGTRLASDSLFVLVNDGDNHRLALTRATLLLPTYRLRFFRQEGTPLTLVYGSRDVFRPTYDLQLIAPRLLDAPAVEVAASPAQGAAGTSSLLPQRAFWAVLAAVVLVLLVLVARLLRAGPDLAGDAKA